MNVETEFRRGREAVDALPDHVRICGHDFRIEKWSPQEATGARRWGECSFTAQVIRVSHNMPSGSQAVDTFIHETLHALFWAFGIDDEDKEERIVGTLGTAMTMLHRDNPWLATWISAQLAA
jgi:hypothetical protein